MERFALQLRRFGWAVLLILGTALAGQTEPASVPSAQAQEVMRSTPAGQLVDKVINNELNAHDEGRFLYRDWRQTPEGSKTKEMVETNDGVVAKLIAINDHSLTPQQRADEDARLQNLLQHPEVQKQKQKDQQQDDDRVRKMFRELPKAFHYEYDGTENGSSGELIRLKFTPNPQYHPPPRGVGV